MRLASSDWSQLVRIRLLGGLDALSAEGEPVRFATRKSALLFAALVLAGTRGLRREQLADAFWPGRGYEQSRNSLRQALVDIRRLFPTGTDAAISIESDQQTVALMASADEADVWTFDLCLKGGRTAELASAAELYRGDLLADIPVPDGAEELLEPYRTNYRRKAQQLVERLSLTLPAPQTAEIAVVCEKLAERLLASDATMEAAHRALIRIHRIQGHENAALRQFETCRSLLRKHLGVEPEAETVSLVAALQARDGSVRAASAPIAEPPQQSLAIHAQHRERPSVAVLPFQNLSDDPEQEYFAHGVVEDIIIALTHFRQLYVIAQNSSATDRGQIVDPVRLGRELNVPYVVQGSVRRTGDRLRIAGRLIDASTGAHLWADRFDGTLADVFELQDQVASSIVGAITPKVEEAEIERAKRKPTDSLDAYDYYLRGLAAFDRTVTSKAAVNDALRLFMNAIERDPEFAAAHARAARCYATRMSNGWMVDRAKEVTEAKRLARRAVELGRDDAIALSFGGYVLGYVGGDLDESSACIDRALSLNPHLAVALGVSSWVNACLGEPDKAVEHAALAMRLSPLDPRVFAWQFNTGLAHFCAGRYDDAVTWAGKSLCQQPNYPSAMRVTAAAHALAGRLVEAQAAAAPLSKLAG